MKKNGLPDHAQCVFEGITFSIYQWEQKLFNGETVIFEKAMRKNSIDVVAITEAGKILILEEEQPGREKFYGLVGGSCEGNEEPLQTAQRELLEETGMVSDDWEGFSSHAPSSRMVYENHIFIARNCKKIQEQSLDAGGEKIKIIEVEWNEFLEFIVSDAFRVKEFSLEVLKILYKNQEQELKKRIFGK
ncbi:MAG: hypothetical protein CR971_00090 [candidate division SR1 bacterium]|nr:MAG: hypothetical protein CR971_00090 [candidate division SR1 bacterium]